MRILAVAQQPQISWELENALRDAVPQNEILAFHTEAELEDYLAENFAQVMFFALDTDAAGMEQVRRLRKRYPKLNIICVSESEQYAREAIALHVSGYLVTPLAAEEVREELADLRYPVENSAILLRLQCFGNFNVLDAAGEVVSFGRSKSKELLAYLTYLRGASCTVREAAAILFENTSYDEKQQNYTQQIIAAMIRGLKRVGAERVIIRHYNSLALNTELVDCDYYRMESEQTGRERYTGEFMAQYSWAESVAGYLSRKNSLL